MTVAELKARIDAGEIDNGTLTVLDVREIREFHTGHVPGAINIPMALIPLRVHELRRSSEIAVICEAGGRSSQSAAWLEQNGYSAASVTGGTGYWRSSGYDIVND
ncbi:MAG: hypothetical protein RL410_592 [Actinomycetota bacterium]